MGRDCGLRRGRRRIVAASVPRLLTRRNGAAIPRVAVPDLAAGDTVNDQAEQADCQGNARAQ